MKKVDDMATSTAVGPGWFKIWHEGYNESTQQWCVDEIIKNKGLLDVGLPSGLPAGYYLVRPELLALHQASSLKDPQYYVGCAQIYIQSGPAGSLEIPSEYSVSIPGYIDGSEPGNTFNLYEKPHLPYLIPGPKPYSPVGASANTKTDMTFNGGVPSGCLIKNANWCGVKLKDYSSKTGCWNAVEACYAQGDNCFSSAPPTGAKNCYIWNDKMCKGIEAQCGSNIFRGPPEINLSTQTTAIRSIVFASQNPEDFSSVLGANTGSGFLLSIVTSLNTGVTSSATADRSFVTTANEYLTKIPITYTTPASILDSSFIVADHSDASVSDLERDRSNVSPKSNCRSKLY